MTEYRIVISAADRKVVSPKVLADAITTWMAYNFLSPESRKTAEIYRDQERIDLSELEKDRKREIETMKPYG